MFNDARAHRGSGDRRREGWMRGGRERIRTNKRKRRRENYIRSKIDIASVPSPSPRFFIYGGVYFYEGSFLLLGLLLLFHTRREIIFNPLCRERSTANNTRKYVVLLPAFWSLYITYYRAATGLNVASVLCANRSTLFFDVCNICYGNINARQKEREEKKRWRGISAVSTGIFQRAVGAVSPQNTTEIRREKKTSRG